MKYLAPPQYKVLCFVVAGVNSVCCLTFNTIIEFIEVYEIQLLGSVCGLNGEVQPDEPGLDSGIGRVLPRLLSNKPHPYHK